jgi:hypothetical protein
MVSNFLIKTFKKKGLIYSETESWEGKTYTFEARLKDPVYGTIAFTKTTDLEPTEASRKEIALDTQTELLANVLEYGKENMISNLLKRLERMN